MGLQCFFVFIEFLSFISKYILICSIIHKKEGASVLKKES